ncbi:tetraspanin-8-like [Asparagus officinalis]|uniref:tetraspanin-8-like n=1 Tax=Asparagus officinalis TaxID=4686 RepID=UPI00098E38E5|nr:tetraspanin-8-like [Asparagus officinalis]
MVMNVQKIRLSQLAHVRHVATPIIAISVFLLVVSLCGLVGTYYRNYLLLWIYLLVMFLLILLLFCFTVFAFVVTSKGASEVVSGRGYKEYRLRDYSNWLQKWVESSKNWWKIRSYLVDSKVCQKFEVNDNRTLD